MLIQRANEYELQSQRIEQEINEYKRLMQEAGQSQARHGRPGSVASSVSIKQPPQNLTVMSHPDQSHLSQPASHTQLTGDQQQFAHYKKKSRKLERRNQKLTIERELNIRHIQDLQGRLQELTDKYRDMKQKMHLKL